MTKFQDGQDVEVRICEADPVRHGFHVRWHKAKIVAWEPGYGSDIAHQVQFPDGTRALFDTENIRTS